MLKKNIIDLEELSYRARKYLSSYSKRLAEIEVFPELKYQMGVYTYSSITGIKKIQVENLDIAELERYWFWPFLSLIDKKEFKENCCWVCLGLFESEKETHWLYICDDRYLKNVLFCFSLIGNPKYQEILNSHLILSYYLLKKIQEQEIEKENLSYPLFIPLESEVSISISVNAPCYYLISWTGDLPDLSININNISINSSNQGLYEFIECYSYENHFKSNTKPNFSFKIIKKPTEQEISLSDDLNLKLANYIKWMLLSANNEGKLILTIPSWYIPGYEKVRSSAVIICLKNYNSELVHKTISAFHLINSYFSYQTLCFYNKKIETLALRSAISAIMSRNMSHNIGSHVLAYLRMESNKEVIKLKELIQEIEKLQYLTDLDNAKEEIKNCRDRIEEIEDLTGNTAHFFRYLQHRMDFISQISTDWPKWSFSVYFMRDLMRNFLMQKNLLDGIAKSEGLSYERVKIYVNINAEWNYKLQNYPDINELLQKRILLHPDKLNIKESDIKIAIPGGIIGYHAFYVILENIIRNSAKHGYTKMKNIVKDLEITIEFTDDPKNSDEFWLFRVYDNVSKIYSRTDSNKRFRIFSESKKKKRDSRYLVEYINECLRHRIIKEETGELEKRFWGIAELKIAAGYIQGRSMQHIGAKGDKITGSEENQNCDKEDFIIRAIESRIGTLGYEFKVKKPKEVGIVIYDDE